MDKINGKLSEFGIISEDGNFDYKSQIDFKSKQEVSLLMIRINDLF